MIPCLIDGTGMDFLGSGLYFRLARRLGEGFGKPVRPDHIRLCTGSECSPPCKPG